jgi:hypothetical protein
MSDEKQPAPHTDREVIDNDYKGYDPTKPFQRKTPIGKKNHRNIPRPQNPDYIHGFD